MTRCNDNYCIDFTEDVSDTYLTDKFIKKDVKLN